MSKYARNMQEICRKYAKKYAKKYARNMQNMQENMQNMLKYIFCIFSENMHFPPC